MSEDDDGAAPSPWSAPDAPPPAPAAPGTPPPPAYPPPPAHAPPPATYRPPPAYPPPYDQAAYPPPAYPTPAYPTPGYPAVAHPFVRRYPVVLPISGRRPPLAVFLVIIGLLLAHVVWSWARYGPTIDDVATGLSDEIWWLEVGAAALVVVITLLGRWSRSVGWVPRRGTAAAVPLIAAGLCALAVTLIAASGADLAWGPAPYAVLLVNCLAVGVFEETMFRGLLWASLPERWSASRVLLVTSVCFGAIHLSNGFSTGRWGTAVAQACAVSVVGLGLGALRMRSGWIGLGVLTHALVDAALTAAGLSVTTALDRDPVEPQLPVLVVLLMLVFLAGYATLAISGIVVLVRTFRSERQQRRLAALVPTGPWPPGPAAPPTLVG